MKKTLSILLAALLVVGCFSFAQAEKVRDAESLVDVIVDAPSVKVQVNDPNGVLLYSSADEYYITESGEFTVRIKVSEDAELDR